jgi:hypothetical protein
VRQADSKNEVSININDNSDAAPGDTTRVSLGKKKLIIVDDENQPSEEEKKKRKNKNKVSLSPRIDLGVNGFSSSYSKLAMPAGYSSLNLDYAKSLVVGIHLIDANLRLYRNNVSLKSGFGLEYNRYAFENNIMLLPDAPKLTAIPSSSISYKKNYLKGSSITVPLLLQVKGSHKKSFHTAFGVIGKYQYTTAIKQVFDVGNSTIKSKIYNDFNVNPYKLDATVRLGFGKFTLFATYGLTDFFKSSEAPEMHSYSVGVQLIKF